MRSLKELIYIYLFKPVSVFLIDHILDLVCLWICSISMLSRGVPLFVHAAGDACKYLMLQMYLSSPTLRQRQSNSLACLHL